MPTLKAMRSQFFALWTGIFANVAWKKRFPCQLLLLVPVLLKQQASWVALIVECGWAQTLLG